MTHCGGCGTVLGWKKYKFHRMWRIPGYYCKQCMLDLGKEFDQHARLTTPTKPCALCGVEYYFLKMIKTDHKRNYYCHVCHDAVQNGVVPRSGTTRQPPRKLPQVMMIFAGLGVLMMVMGLVFTMMSTGDNANVTNILFGAVTTALGFVLFKKTMRSRSMLLGGKIAAK